MMIYAVLALGGLCLILIASVYVLASNRIIKSIDKSKEEKIVADNKARALSIVKSADNEKMELKNADGETLLRRIRSRISGQLRKQ